MKKPAFGRLAIEWLKTQYLAGVHYEGGVAVRDAIANAFSGKLSKCSIATATAWDRQARMELAVDNTFVTQPVHRTGYLRTPNARPTQRRDTQGVRLRELETRIARQSLMANAAAAQIDATALEIRQAAQLSIAERIVREVAASGGI